jgi:hypothetical protein
MCKHNDSEIGILELVASETGKVYLKVPIGQFPTFKKFSKITASKMSAPVNKEVDSKY